MRSAADDTFMSIVTACRRCRYFLAGAQSRLGDTRVTRGWAAAVKGHRRSCKNCDTCFPTPKLEPGHGTSAAATPHLCLLGHLVSASACQVHASTPLVGSVNVGDEVVRPLSPAAMSPGAGRKWNAGTADKIYVECTCYDHLLSPPITPEYGSEDIDQVSWQCVSLPLCPYPVLQMLIAT